MSGRPPSTATPTAAPPRCVEPSAVGLGSHTSPSPHRGTVAPTSPSPVAVDPHLAFSCRPCGLGYRYFPFSRVTAATALPATVAPCRRRRRPPGLLPTRRSAFPREERENVREGEREKGWCGILTCGIHVGPTLRDKVSYISHSHPRSHFIVECHAIISFGCVRLQGLQQRCSLYEQ